MSNYKLMINKDVEKNLYPYFLYEILYNDRTV